MSSSDNTTDNRFKKTTQTVGANGNDVTRTDATLNDSIIRDRAPGNADNRAEATDHNSKIERDLQEKVRMCAVCVWIEIGLVSWRK